MILSVKLGISKVFEFNGLDFDFEKVLELLIFFLINIELHDVSSLNNFLENYKFRSAEISDWVSIMQSVNPIFVGFDILSLLIVLNFICVILYQTVVTPILLKILVQFQIIRIPTLPHHVF